MSNVFDKKIVNGEVALKLLQGLKSKVDSTDIQAKRVKGVLDISNIPQSALPTLVVVQDDDERFKLTQDRVKKGDTVKVIKTNKLYLVTDTSQLSSPSGYTEYAQTVEWENIEGKPSSFPPSVHSQTSDSISHMKLYQKGSDTSDITTNDTLNVAIGKLEAKLDIKLNKIESGLNGEEKDVVKSLNKNSGQFIKSKIDNINQITQQGWYLCNSNCEGAPTEYEGIVVNYLTGNGNSVKIWYSVTQESVYIMQDLFGAERKEWTQVITQTDIDGMKETITQAIEKKQNKIDDMLVTSSKEIVGAINELHTQKQNANDGRLNTDAKEVVGAINELKEGKAELIHSHNDLYTTTEQLTQLLAGKEDVFVKNTAFNKNFGTTSGTVADGKAVEDLRVELSNISEKVAPMIEGKLDKTGGKITGNLEIDGNLVTKNNTGVQCKDSSGIAKTVIYMDDTDTIKVGDGNVSIVIDSENVTLKGGKTLWDSQNFNPTAKQDVNDSHLQTENKTVVGSINEVLTLTKKVSSDLATKAPLVHDHDDSYMPRQELDETINTLTVEIQSKEPAIVDKGTAFNKDFGTTVGTVLEGTHLATITSKIEEKQNKTDISLETSNKTIVGAINEIKKNTISATGGNIDGAIQSLEFNGRGNYNIVSSLENGAQVHGTFAGRARSSTGVGEILVYNKTSSSGIRFKDDGNVTIEGKTLTAQASNLQTSAKDVVGAINELKTKKLDLSGGTLVGHADMLKLDTSKPSDSSYIKFLNGGVEKGWIGKGSSATDSIAIHNSTSNKGMTFRHDGALQLDATNLRTKNKEVVGAINELVATKLSTDGSTKMTGSLSFGYGNPTTPNIKFLDSSGSIHGSLNARGGGVDEDIYLENNTSGNGIYFKDNGEVRLSSKKSMWIGAPNLATHSKEVIGAINELSKKEVDTSTLVKKAGDTMTGSLTVNGGIKTTINTALAVQATRGDYTAMFGCSATSGEFVFGGRPNSASDYQSYIRVSPTKLQYYKSSSSGYNIWHSGNFNPDNISAGTVKIKDTRSGALLPHDFEQYKMTPIFTNKDLHSDWCSILTMKGWTSGYTAWQLGASASSTTNNRGLFFRQSNGSANTWGAWGQAVIGDGTASLIYPQSGNEINFSSSSGHIWFGYRQRGSTPVTTYKFGNSSSSSSANGNIECGSLKVRNNAVWHAGNFNPSNLLTAKIVGGQVGFGAQVGDNKVGIFAGNDNEINFSSASKYVMFGYRQVGTNAVNTYKFCDGTSTDGKGTIECGEVKIRNNIAWHNGYCRISKAQNGYAKFPNGLIVQWGKTGVVNSSVDTIVSLPTSFTSTGYSVAVSSNIHGATRYFDMTVHSQTTSNFKIWHSNQTSSIPSAPSATWIAIGY